jgi:hypothetical protein
MKLAEFLKGISMNKYIKTYYLYLSKQSLELSKELPEPTPDNWFILDTEELKELRSLIDKVIPPPRTEPDPNLLIDYLKEQAAEESYNTSPEWAQVMSDFLLWKTRNPYITTIDYTRQGRFVIYNGVRDKARPCTKECATLLEAFKEVTKLT